MLRFLKEMLASGVTFTLKVRTNHGLGLPIAAQGGLLNVDTTGLTIDDPDKGFVLLPWSAVHSLEYEEHG